MSRAATFVIIFHLLATNFVAAAEIVDINNAPIEDLIKIIHIGEKRALELISLRPFSSLDDLARIKGIGDARIQDIKTQGLAWIDGGETSIIEEASPPSSLPAPKETTLPAPEVFEAAIDSPVQKTSFFLLIAGVLAIFSGATILILKKGLK